MRLKHLHIIGEYKNLKDFKLDFDGTSFIDVFVGKNGTGKSNLFEAVIEIFKHIFDHDYPISFDYKLNYELDGEHVLIYRKDGEWRDDDKQKIAFVNKKFLPANILVYYSGHNDTIGDFINDFSNKHRDKLNRNRSSPNFDGEDARLFFGIGKEYKNILLASILLQTDDLKLKQTIKNRLGIENVGAEIKMVFQKPSFAKGRTFDEFDADNRFWGADGYFRDVLNEIWNVKKIEQTLERPSGKIVIGDHEEYILYRSFEDFKIKFSNKSIFEIFITLDNLKTIGLLKEIEIDVQLKTLENISIGQFSDGQFQSVYILAVTEIFKDFNCISLLDEPDAFLHPEWQFDFFKQITDISSDSTESNHILMSSHSAITLIKFLKDKVRYFDFSKAGKLGAAEIPKRIAIDKLSEKLIKYSEQEQILSIINTIQIEKKPVLFTEGKTDPIIIKEAWNKLNPEKDIPFIPFYAFGHKYLAQLMQDPEVIKDMEGLPIFGLFDYDKAYNTWHAFSDDSECVDPYLGLIKKMANKEVYAMMLPVPKGKPIEDQVINKITGGTFGENAVMAIEHIFSHLPKVASMFKEDIKLPIPFKRFHGDKVDFAKLKVPTFPDECFEVFQPMFDFIESKIPNS
ncbi:MAG: AAA family ATPase [Weeksellaceae bacterium]|nr:AAA family ATPase [Bacteroidota bacterium]MCG2781461.1 AAA family ATPase [Weeksellaceae bacterium]